MDQILIVTHFTGVVKLKKCIKTSFSQCKSISLFVPNGITLQTWILTLHCLATMSNCLQSPLHFTETQVKWIKHEKCGLRTVNILLELRDSWKLASAVCLHQYRPHPPQHHSTDQLLNITEIPTMHYIPNMCAVVYTSV